MNRQTLGGASGGSVRFGVLPAVQGNTALVGWFPSDKPGYQYGVQTELILGVF